MNESEATQKPLPRVAKGKRPTFFSDPGIDQVYSIAVELAAELAVALDRIDTLERQLESHGLLKRAELKDYQPDAATESERATDRDNFLRRVFRVLVQQGENPTQ